MKLIEIKGLFEMDTGSPSPMIISNDNELFITFYTDKRINDTAPVERNTIYDRGVFGIKFKLYRKFTFGLPSNETLQGHPYYKLGLKSFRFYELQYSDLIKNLQKIESVHPYYNADIWQSYKHFIITFHDNMFECIAKEFEIREDNISTYRQASIILNELSVKQF